MLDVSERKCHLPFEWCANIVVKYLIETNDTSPASPPTFTAQRRRKMKHDGEAMAKPRQGTESMFDRKFRQWRTIRRRPVLPSYRNDSTMATGVGTPTPSTHTFSNALLCYDGTLPKSK